MFGVIHPGAGIRSWSFSSFKSGAGRHYVGGAYVLGPSSFVPSVFPQVLGTVLVSYAAHAFIVLGAACADMVVRVSGTSITDAALRIVDDFEDLIARGGVLGDYLETPKKWLGQVAFTLLRGEAVAVNYGLCKYWDHNNQNYTLKGLEVTGFAGANDAVAQLQLLHHRPAGWTYNEGGEPTPPSPLATMQANHGTEVELATDEPFNWKRDNLDVAIAGHEDEGILFEVTVGSNKSIGNADFSVTYEA